MILSEHWPKALDEALHMLAGVTDGLPVVAHYTRVSSDIQVDEGHSLELQAEHQRVESEARYPDGCHVLFLSDEGLSGTLFWKKDGLRRGQYRPGLTLLKELVDLGLVNSVGVYRCNRFARRARIWLEFKEDYLDPHEVVFFSTSEGIDTAQSSTQMIFHILMSEAEHAHGQIATGVKDGLATRRSEGYYVGCPPYGWRWQDERFIPEGSRINIEPVGEEADVIRRMIQWCLDGMSPGKIATRLTSEGVATAARVTAWAKITVKKVLLNPTNAGLIRDGNGGLARGLHYSHRIIEPEAFYRVQEILATRREASQDENRPQGLIFDGILTCGVCGKRLQLASPSRMAAHYRCRGKTGGPHEGYHLRADLVESRLQKAILQSAAAQAAAARAAARLKQESDEHEQGLRRTIRRLSDRLARNHDDICLWAGRMGDAACDQEEVESELAWLADERRKTEDELTRAKADAKRWKSRETKCKLAMAVAANLVRLWDRATVEEKRELIRRLIESLTCEPTDTGVTVHLGFVSGDTTDIRFYVRAKTPARSGDLWAIGPSLLTTAYYLQQGMNAREIAQARGIGVGVVWSHTWALKKLTRCSSLADTITALTPVIEARIDELDVNEKVIQEHQAAGATG